MEYLSIFSYLPLKALIPSIELIFEKLILTYLDTLHVTLQNEPKRSKSQIWKKKTFKYYLYCTGKPLCLSEKGQLKLLKTLKTTVKTSKIQRFDYLKFENIYTQKAGRKQAINTACKGF